MKLSIKNFFFLALGLILALAPANRLLATQPSLSQATAKRRPTPVVAPMPQTAVPQAETALEAKNKADQEVFEALVKEIEQQYSGPRLSHFIVGTLALVTGILGAKFGPTAFEKIKGLITT
jgi:hypothetical protein